MTKRVLVEAFKYSPLREILTALALVCHEWQKVAYSSEILLTFLSNDPEADPISSLDFYQRVKEAKLAIRYLLHISKGTMLTWHLVESNVTPVSCTSRIYLTSSRYVLTTHSRAMITGGEGLETSCVNVDVKSRKMRQRAAMLRKHAWHAIAMLDKVVYVSGGCVGNQPVRYAELFQRGRWVEIANMTTPRHNHTLCSYKKRIYAFGGSNGVALDSIEYYDGCYWTLTPWHLPMPAECVSLLPVKSGLVLVSTPFHSTTGYIYIWEEAAQVWRDLGTTVTESSLSNSIAVRNGCLFLYSRLPAQVSIPLPFVSIA